MMIYWSSGSKLGHVLTWTAALGLALVLLMSGCSRIPRAAGILRPRQPVVATGARSYGDANRRQQLPPILPHRQSNADASVTKSTSGASSPSS